MLEGSIDAWLANLLVDKQERIDAALDKPADGEDDRLLVGLIAEAARRGGIETRKRGSKPTETEVQAAAEAIERAATEDVTREQVVREAVDLTPEQVEAIHRALRIVAGMCDGARRLDGCGFSRFDTGIGHDLASRSALTARQAVLGLRLVQKYRRQLPEELLVAAKGEAKP